MEQKENAGLRYKIILGDCLDGLRTIEKNSVNAVLTDPPYSSGGREATKSVRSTMTASVTAEDWFGSDSMSVEGFSHLMRECAKEWYRILAPGGHILAFIDWRMVAHLQRAIESADLLYRGLLVWDKTYFSMGTHFRNQHEFILHFSKSTPSKARRRDVPNVLQCKPIRNGMKGCTHPTQKPVPLLRRLLGVVTSPGDHVVDCFHGSGSTGVAALLSNCRYTGIEREPRFYHASGERLEKCYLEDN